MKQRIDVAAVPTVTGSRYPSPFDEPCRNKSRQGLGAIAGLTQFGVNLLRLEPGAWSSQRHWHNKEDEFVYVLMGEVVLVADSGEEILRAGDAAGFKAGDRNGHCLQNRSSAEAQVLEVGTARRTTPVTTQTLTWWRRPDICPRFTPVVMARPTRTSDGARDAEQIGILCSFPLPSRPVRSRLLYDRSRINGAGQSDHMRAVDVTREWLHESG
jgi:uncharacterized cupin superfamily protein